MPGTEGGQNASGRSPFFSPNGQWLGFWHAGQLKKVSVSGGAPVPLAAAAYPWGASWSADDTIVYGQGPAGIWRVPASGGTPENLVKVEAGESAQGPQLLPGGRALLFTVARGNAWDDALIVVHSLDSGLDRSLSKAVAMRAICRPVISCMRFATVCWRCPSTREA